VLAAPREYSDEGQIAGIVAVIRPFGFLNRWNDAMATPLEADPVEVGEKHLAGMGRRVGKHARTSSWHLYAAPRAGRARPRACRCSDPTF